jgi:hypothetical protein
MEKEEIWKYITKPEYSKFYKVSTKGSIKNIKTQKIISQHIRNGYKAVCLYSPDTKKKNTYNVHRLVSEAFIPIIDNKLFINHKDGIFWKILNGFLQKKILNMLLKQNYIKLILKL